jgi:dihydrofolate reductase
MSQLLRVQNFCVSMDGFGAGEGQSLEAPFGHADRRSGGVARLPADLVSSAGATASGPNRTEPGGSRGLDDYFTRDFTQNIGAEIMGRNKFGPQRGPWDNLDWKGWWGDTPPFHIPVFVLTHHQRPSFTLADTTFHFLEAELIDTIHVSVAPVEIGRGERTLDLPGGPARPVPPRVRAQPQRRYAPALLAAVTTTADGLRSVFGRSRHAPRTTDGAVAIPYEPRR